MSRSPFFGIVCAVFGVMLLWSAKSSNIVPAPPGPNPTPQPGRDLVVVSFDLYERLWRETALKVAEKLEQGELETEEQTWQFLADQQSEIRKQAFDQIAKKEQQFFTEANGWSAKNHATLLRSYQRGK